MTRPIEDSYELGESLTQQLARTVSEVRMDLATLRRAVDWALRYLEERDYELVERTLKVGLRETEPR